MYQDFLTLLRNQGSLLHDLDAIQDQSLKDEHVLGVQIGIDRYWSQSYLTRFLGGGLASQPGRSALSWRYFHHFGEFPEITLGYRPPHWGQYCLSRGYSLDANPVYFKFTLLKQPGKAQRMAFSETDLHRHPVMYEYRPPTIVNSSAFPGSQKNLLSVGVSVWSSSGQQAGTAGGFLRHPASGQAYLVSCSHILGAVGSDVHFPPPTTRGRSNIIGQVALNFPPAPQTKLLHCSPANLESAAQLDLGLVELRPEVDFDPEIPNLGRVQMTSAISEMGPFDPVSVFGSASGLVNAELGSLCIWQEMTIDNKQCCFRNLFTLTPPYPHGKDARLIESGDSGAWVINTTAGMPAWDGMIIGSDGSCAYACFAETIMDVCTERLNHALAVIH